MRRCQFGSARMSFLKFIWMFLILAFVKAEDIPGGEPAGATRAKLEKDLRETLLNNYDKAVMPTMNTSQILSVRIELFLTGLQEVNLEKRRLTASAWVKMEWNDHRLWWNSTSHGNILELPFHQEDIYVPEIGLFNIYAPTNQAIYAPTMLTVFTHSEVIWMPAASLSVLCNMSSANWPYDEHTCEFIFGHVSRDKNTFNLIPDCVELDMTSFTTKPIDWEVVKSGVMSAPFYRSVGDNYDTVRFNLTVRRNPPAYLRSIYFTPHILLFTSLLIFWIRDQNARLLFGALEFLASTAFGICFFIVAPKSQEIKALRLISGLPVMILLALIASHLLDFMEGLTVPLPSLNGFIKRKGHRNFNSASLSFISGISTEQLNEMNDQDEEVENETIEETPNWLTITFYSRIFVFAIYCLTSVLLSLLTALNTT